MKRTIISMVAVAMFCSQVTAQSFTIPQTTVPQGGRTTLVVNYQFDSEGIYTGYQLDIALPEGFTFTQDGNNNLDYTLGDCHSSTHMMGASYVAAEDVYNCTCVSMQSDPLTGTSGVLFKLEVMAAASMAVGTTYTGTLQNMALAKVNGQSVPVADVTFTLVVGEPVGPPPTEVSLTIGKLGVSTFASPYDLNFGNMTGMKAYVASGFNPSTGRLVLTRVEEVPAGTGLYIKGTQGTYTIPVEETAILYVNFLVGLTEDTEVSPTTATHKNFFLSNGLHGVGFYTTSEARTITAGKAYLSIPISSESASANYIGLEFEDEETTSITSAECLTPNDGFWYTLDGRKLDKKPTQKGVYIVNGKKLVIK